MISGNIAPTVKSSGPSVSESFASSSTPSICLAVPPTASVSTVSLAFLSSLFRLLFGRLGPELLHSAQTLRLTLQPVIGGLGENKIVDKGAGVKRFPLSRRLARSKSSAGVGFLGLGKVRRTQPCQNQSSLSTTRRHNLTHRNIPCLSLENTSG